MSIAITIEALRPDDVGELVTLQRAAFLRDAQLYGDPFIPALTQSSADIMLELSDADRLFLVAKLGSRMVGAVRAHRTGSVTNIGRLMTAPDLEGRGIAGRLMDAVEAAGAPHSEWFELSTGSRSTASVAMYARRGYAVVSEHEAAPGMRVVTMRKPARVDPE